MRVCVYVCVCVCVCVRARPRTRAHAPALDYLPIVQPFFSAVRVISFLLLGDRFGDKFECFLSQYMRRF